MEEMHILSTIGLVVCVIGLSSMIVSVASYITDHCDDLLAYTFSMLVLIVAALSACYGLSVLISLE